MKINFISNIAPEEISGGISGMNSVACEALREIATINYVGPISPPISLAKKGISKVRRLCGFAGTYYFYSSDRLQQIAAEVSNRCDPSADLDFYMGFTPWILCKSPRPYVAWNDCSFQDYLAIYHSEDSFLESDQRRITAAEAAWMSCAQRIFLSSEWAVQRICSEYHLPVDDCCSIGIFGSLEPPLEDQWDGSKDFYFISTNYTQKNGPLSRQAMNFVWEVHPEARLRIIGAAPPARDLVDGKVIYEGFFRKSEANELLAFRSHLSRAFAVIHPTDADITPLTLIEAAFFGCPAVSVDDFALREVISPTNHHLLLPRPLLADSLASAMISLLDSRFEYERLRQNARTFALSQLTPIAFKQRLLKVIKHITGHNTLS